MGFSNKGMRIRWSLHCNHNVPVFFVFFRFTLVFYRFALVLLLQISLFSIKRATFWRIFTTPSHHFLQKQQQHPLRHQNSSGFLTSSDVSPLPLVFVTHWGCMLRYVMAHKKAMMSGKEDVGKHMMG